jgi:hypothetical protein
MGELLRRNVRNRYADLVDWVDYRPDINMAWGLGLLAMIAMCAFSVPASVFELATIMAIASTMAIMCVCVALALALVIFSAIYDTVTTTRLRRDSRLRPVQAAHQVF